MSRRHDELDGRDLEVLARALGADPVALAADLDARPRSLGDVLARPEVLDAVLGADSPFDVSARLLFAVLVHQAAESLVSSEWVEEWVGPGSRLPVFDVDPLVEFADAPGRLFFTARLLETFATPTAFPVPVDRLELDDLVDWLDAVEPGDRAALLRTLGDLALFRAGVFPDSAGPVPLSADRAEHLGRSVQLSDDELDHLVDHGSATPGLDALETLSSAWYRAAAECSPATPVLLRDVAHRIRAARRFLNVVADRYLHPLAPPLSFGA